jgi:hypothetical protein
MKKREFNLEILTPYYVYDYDTGEPSMRYAKKNIPGDLDLITWNVLELKQTVLQMDKGFFIESW